MIIKTNVTNGQGITLHEGTFTGNAHDALRAGVELTRDCPEGIVTITLVPSPLQRDALRDTLRAHGSRVAGCPHPCEGWEGWDTPSTTTRLRE